MSRNELIESAVQPAYLPMLVPPRPWTAPRTGAYLSV